MWAGKELSLMNINTNIYKQYINSGGSYGRTVQKTFGAGSGKSVIKQDSLSFSAEAALIKDNVKTVKNYAAQITSPASEERIGALQEQIRNGEYNVSAQQVADKILNRWV